MALAAVAEDYFRSINPLAEKIHEDIVEARNSYENIWDTLSEKEKTEIINETLIKPEISLKYALLDTLEFDLNDPPVRKDDLMSFFGREHGQKIVQDEYGSYRDEHSAPFLYQTKSQLNLCVLGENRTQKAVPPPSSPPVQSELEMSHFKVVNELKFAIRSHDIRKAANGGSRRDEPEDDTAPGFISKFMNTFKNKESDRQRLVRPSTPEKATDLYSTYRTPTNEHKFEKEYRNSAAMSSGDLSEENRGLLSSHGSSDFQSSETLTDSVPKSGYDFLDNW